MPRRERDGRVGVTGERHARILLEAHGYRFVASNWRCTAGELDLVMLDGEELVFIEVKTRRGDHAGRADDAITPGKARRMLAAAEWFLAQHPAHQHRLWRCDMVAITLAPDTGRATVRHYVNAIVDG